MQWLHFKWFCACVAVMTLAGVLTLGTKDACTGVNSSCVHVHTCESTCGDGYRTCQSGCPYQTETSSKCYDACTQSYERCVRTCQAVGEDAEVVQPPMPQSVTEDSAAAIPIRTGSGVRSGIGGGPLR